MDRCAVTPPRSKMQNRSRTPPPPPTSSTAPGTAETLRLTDGSRAPSYPKRGANLSSVVYWPAFEQQRSLPPKENSCQACDKRCQPSSVVDPASHGRLDRYAW